MAAVSAYVVDEADVEPIADNGDTATTRLTFQVDHLEQRVCRFALGRRRERTADDRHDLLYVVAGRGTVEVDGKPHPLEPGTAVFVAPGETYTVENPGPDELLIVDVAAKAEL